MQTTSSRDYILKKIAAVSNRRPAFIQPPAEESESIYKPILPDAISCFVNELEAISGKCYLCKNEQDMYTQVQLFIGERDALKIFCRDTIIRSQLEKNGLHPCPESDFTEMQIGITACEFLVARTGSVLISSDSPNGRQMNVFPPVHIVLAHISQLVDYPEDAIKAIQEKYGESLPSMISFITGPSRTADIEKTLVLGAHGPKEFIVFLSKE